MWERNNVEGKGDAPPYEGFSGPLLVCGASRSLWDDLERFWAWGVDCDVAAINYTIIFYPRRKDGKWPLQHAICADPDWVEKHLEHRERRHRLHRDVITHSAKEPARCIWQLSNLRNMAFSASFASAIGLAMGYDKIILAGCSQAGDGHFYDPPWTREQKDMKCYLFQWSDNMQMFRDKVKSMSGVTRDILGEPTEEWLKEGVGVGVNN